MNPRPLPWAGNAEPPRLQQATVRGLRRTGHVLVRLARWLAQPAQRVAAVPPTMEFHAEAGAPEGALYVDGQLVGHLPGITRL